MRLGQARSARESQRIGRAYAACMLALVASALTLMRFLIWASAEPTPDENWDALGRTLIGAAVALVVGLVALPVLSRMLGLGVVFALLTVGLLTVTVLLRSAGGIVVVPIAALTPAAAALATELGFRDRRPVLAVGGVALLVTILVVASATVGVARASRYAGQIDASGVAPYAPDGWSAVTVGAWSEGELGYRMRDGSGHTVSVTVRRPTGVESDMASYQRRLLDRYGVLVSLELYDGAGDSSGEQIGPFAAGMRPRSARWLADRACWACRLTSRLTDAGLLFG